MFVKIIKANAIDIFWYNDKIGKIYNVYEKGSVYEFVNEDMVYQISKKDTEIYTPFVFAKMVCNPDGSCSFHNPTAFILKKDIMTLDTQTNKIYVGGQGLKSYSISPDFTANFKLPMVNAVESFSVAVMLNNSDYFEPLYEEEPKKISDVKKVNIVFRLKKIKDEAQDLIDFIEKKL